MMPKTTRKITSDKILAYIGARTHSVRNGKSSVALLTNKQNELWTRDNLAKFVYNFFIILNFISHQYDVILKYDNHLQSD